jgi:CRISPR-associated protein Cas1
MPDEYLWPARNVAEHAYCPRLFYFMEVEGVHYASTDTVQGTATHRRVDKPSRLSPVGPDSEAPGDAKPQSVRSLTLTSSQLRLTATLDLAEIHGNTAVPVEYRKGKPRQIMADDGAHSEPWPTDRVQLGLQALLLREHGYLVELGAIYYESTRQRIAVAVDDLLIQDALAELQSAQATADGPRPEPLRNDPRCNGCSLRAHCLPDEFHALRGESAPPGSLGRPAPKG